MGTRVLILAGGLSDEHTVSLISGGCVLEAMAGARGLTPHLRVLSRTGGLLGPEESLAAVAARREVATGGAPLSELIEVARAHDVVFPLLHGPMGEDGTLQGLLTLAGVPYVGCGVLASALCMDKPMAKEVLRAQGLPQVPYRLVRRRDVLAGPDQAAQAVAAAIRPPWFVKPANLGSSVGITRCEDRQGLVTALGIAGRYDRRIIVEAGLDGLRELEVAVMGNDALEVSPVGEICHDGRFYDYATKYTPGHSSMVIPADVPEAVAERALELAVQVYRALDCAGLARVDFFYTPSDGRVFVNEVNTLPGFTEFSMFPSLFAARGVPYPALLETLVRYAQEAR